MTSSAVKISLGGIFIGSRSPKSIVFILSAFSCSCLTLKTTPLTLIADFPPLHDRDLVSVSKDS
ncbi:hypothetical protein DL98DRAFT_201705 [Cadophora sp. DSE1049]|nr:hypothetical protein DL98DRAFT_201705 [Cadophora sp. DSE1049]